MAIPAVTPTYQGTGPTQTGQIIVFGNSDEQNLAYRGTAQATLDGSLTAFTVNWIDGTKTLPFTPSAVICTRSYVGTNDTAAASIYVQSASAISNTGFTVNISGAGSNGNTLTVAFIVLK